jgi:16S rRNA (cytosine967-C5)-methyltransferase
MPSMKGLGALFVEKPMIGASAPPLWQLLDATAQIVGAVRRGQSTAVSLDGVAVSLRPGTQALAFQVLRNLGRARSLRRLLAPKPPPAAVDALLCTGLALAWFEPAAPYDIFTLVNQAVEAAKRNPATRGQAGFVNACLRRFLREKEVLITQTNADPEARWNHPLWWIQRLQREQPLLWQTILEANNCHAPMTLRVNTARITRVDYLVLLAEAGLPAEPVGHSGLILGRPAMVSQLPGFAQGLVSVQDAAAQLAAPLLLSGLRGSGHSPGVHVLDACAAPGGKTAHLLEIGSCAVVAVDVDSIRAVRIQENLERLQLQADIQVADASRPAIWWNGKLFDAVMLDAPCTASGIVRRHPDVRWLRRESDVGALVQTQANLLRALWPLVRPGGRLLYCTCSVFKAEGSDQVQTFLAHNTDARLCPSPGHLMPSFAVNPGGLPDNPEDDHDGFFLALLEKSMH